MPHTFDRQALMIDRDPMRSIFAEPAKLPKLDAEAIWRQWLDGLKMLTGLDLSSPLALVTSLGDLIKGALDPAQLLETLGKIFGWASGPLHTIEQLAGWVGQTVFGLIDPRRLAQIPLGSIVAESPNLLPNGSFTDAIAIDDPAAIWVRDTSTYRSAPASARTDANGTIRELLSIDLVPVKPGQKLDVGGWMRWANLSAAAGSIGIGLMTYGTAGEHRVDIKMMPTTGGTVTSWQECKGQYTVPASGVDNVRVRLVVNDGATAGRVFYDDLFASLGSNKLQINFVEGLAGELANALGAAQQAAANLANFLNTQWQQLLNGVAGGVGGTIASIIDRLQHFNPFGLFDASKLRNIGDMPPIGQGQVNGLIGDLGGIIDNAVRGAGNLIGNGFGVFDLFDALRGMQANIADANAALAALQSEQQGNNNSGKKILVNVGEWPDSPDAPTVFTRVSKSGNGGIATVRGALDWQDAGSSSASEIYLYNVDELLSDYFEVAMVMPRRPEDEAFGLFMPTYNYLIGRANAAGDTYVFARVGYSRCRIGVVVNGVTTLLGSDIGFSAPAGSLIRFRGGTSGGVRVFQLQVNSQVVGGATDTGNVSQVGEQFRKVGLAFEAAGRGGGQGTPGSVSVFAANDNAPNPTRGVGFRAYRASTSGVNKGNGNGPLPANCLDTIDRITPDMQWNPATQSLTIGTEGWYMFGQRVEFGSALDGAGNSGVERQWTILLYRRGVVVSSADTVHKGIQTGGNNVVVYPVKSLGGGGMPLYCEVGDVIQPGVYNNATNTIVGDAGGSRTWFTAILLNRSLA
ncbi:minor tail protein [Mycobacterium phage Ellie]|uniref:Minor tail protein n=1 Tax=Mycobacterium phage Ellie TaxID=2762405 RepID=A0A7G8LLX7_9CAUD|nr:minor tail protein [Mycobacterium phage Ellie]QNJ58249.1 minor tail protein [Mycobacterium phage Ellie]